MKKYVRFAVLAGLVAGLACVPAFAASGQKSSGQGTSQAKAKPVKLNPKEEKAYKAFYMVPSSQPKEIVSKGEAFLKKYPKSRYAASVYGRLTGAYEALGQTDQMMDAGHKALALNPNDVDVLTMLAYAIPRRVDPNNLDSGTKLHEAAADATKALELLPTLKKPANMTQDQFTAALNAEAASAHSGLGLVDYYEQDIPGMVTQLEQAVKLNPTPDPSDQFLLGIAYMQSNRPADAVDILQKCAAEPGPLAARCKTSLEKAQKMVASQQKKP